MATSSSVVLVTYDPRVISKYLNAKLQVGLVPENISNPSPEVARQIYNNFILLILHVSEHSISTLPLSACTDHDPDTQRQSVPLIIVYQCMKAFIKDNSGEKLDLNMCDLVTPGKNPQRFRRIVSFLMDFMKLHELAAPIFNEITDDLSDRKLEMEALQEDLVLEEKRKNDLLSRQSLRKRRECDLINDHNKVKGELNNIVTQYKENVDNAAELDKAKDEALQQIEAIEREIITGKKTVEHLTEEVLVSPEELKQEMIERKNHIQELEECLKASRSNLETKLEAREICVNSDKNVPIIVEKLRTWSEMRDEIQVLMDSIDENHRNLEEINDQLVFTQDQKNNACKQLIEHAELHEQLKKEHLQRMTELQKNVKEITEQIAVMGKSQPDVSRDIERKRHELLSIKNAHSQAIAKTNNSCEESLAKFQKICAVFKDTQRVATEKKTAGDRALGRVKNYCIGRLPSDYTFSTSSINNSENFDPQSPNGSVFSVFK